MNKMNKKGFTLIEMLVVIAIIAVLVSIIIPTVTSATDRAKAATNAANLRSCKAELVTMMLANGSITGDKYVVDGTSVTMDEDVEADLFKAYAGEIDGKTDAGFVGTIEGLNVTVTYNGLNIATWAEVAGGGLEESEGE